MVIKNIKVSEEIWAYLMKRRIEERLSDIDELLRKILKFKLKKEEEK